MILCILLIFLGLVVVFVLGFLLMVLLVSYTGAMLYPY
jgi:hypothetical protein